MKLYVLQIKLLAEIQRRAETIWVPLLTFSVRLAKFNRAHDLSSIARLMQLGHWGKLLNSGFLPLLCNVLAFIINNVSYLVIYHFRFGILKYDLHMQTYTSRYSRMSFLSVMDPRSPTAANQRQARTQTPVSARNKNSANRQLVIPVSRTNTCTVNNCLS